LYFTERLINSSTFGDMWYFFMLWR
jgi:hypothetical protein